MLDKERLGIDRVHHPNVRATVISLHDIRGLSDALGPGRHAEMSGAAYLPQPKHRSHIILLFIPPDLGALPVKHLALTDIYLFK